MTIGYGSPGCTGVELEFGSMMGDHFDEPVLLIKAAWGGHSLFKLFRSPSAGLPSNLQAELATAQEQVKKTNEKNKKNDPLPTMDDIQKPYGSSYRNMLAEVQATFDNYETLFPELKGRQLEVAGFFWFQGFNDQVGDLQDPSSPPIEYASNMKHFIQDVRKDLGVPNLPFVIAALGQNGSSSAWRSRCTSGTRFAISSTSRANPSIESFRVISQSLHRRGRGLCPVRRASDRWCGHDRSCPEQLSHRSWSACF